MEGIRAWITEHWLAAISGATPTTGILWWLKRSRSLHPIRWFASGSVANIDLITERIERAVDKEFDRERIAALERRIKALERQIANSPRRPSPGSNGSGSGVRAEIPPKPNDA